MPIFAFGFRSVTLKEMGEPDRPARVATPGAANATRWNWGRWGRRLSQRMKTMMPATRTRVRRMEQRHLANRLVRLSRIRCELNRGRRWGLDRVCVGRPGDECMVDMVTDELGECIWASCDWDLIGRVQRWWLDSQGTVIDRKLCFLFGSSFGWAKKGIYLHERSWKSELRTNPKWTKIFSL